MRAVFALALVTIVAAQAQNGTGNNGQGSGNAAGNNGGNTSNGGCGGVKPLINQVCPWPYSGPEQLDAQGDQPRGPMQGYNVCNSTTEGGNSECVIAHINNASDFCFFSNPKLDLIANGEGETVAYCVNKGYGTRYIPAGTITGMQVVYTPGYVAFGILLDQTQVNVSAGDAGGELDPHGADGRGNPIGSLVYTTAFGKGIQQVVEWHEFIGGNVVCQKICNPSFTDPTGNLCENTHDTIGCSGNVPLDYGKINGTFQVCQGDNQQVPNGNSLPIPATSSCTTYASSDLFKSQAFTAPTSSATSSSAPPTTQAAAVSTPPKSASRSGSTSSSLGLATVAYAGPANLLSLTLVGACLTIGAGAIFL